MPHIAARLHCSICMLLDDDCASWDWVVLVACGHIFHDRCIRQWCSSTVPGSRGRKQNTCPECRTRILRLPSDPSTSSSSSARQKKDAPPTRFKKLVLDVDARKGPVESSPAKGPRLGSQRRSSPILELDSEEEVDDEQSLQLQPQPQPQTRVSQGADGTTARAGGANGPSTDTVVLGDTESESDEEDARPARRRLRHHRDGGGGVQAEDPGEDAPERADIPAGPSNASSGGTSTTTTTTTARDADEVRRLRGELHEARALLSSRILRITALEASLRAQQAAHESALSHARDEIAILENRLREHVEVEGRALKEQLGKLKKDKREVGRSLEREKERCASLRNDGMAMTAEISRLKESHEKLSKEHNFLKRTHEEHETHCEEHRNDLAARVSRYKLQHDRAVLDNGTLRGKLERRDESIRLLRAELEAVRTGTSRLDTKGKGRAREGGEDVHSAQGGPARTPAAGHQPLAPSATSRALTNASRSLLDISVDPTTASHNDSLLIEDIPPSQLIPRQGLPDLYGNDDDDGFFDDSFHKAAAGGGRGGGDDFADLDVLSGWGASTSARRTQSKPRPVLADGTNGRMFTVDRGSAGQAGDGKKRKLLVASSASGNKWADQVLDKNKKLVGGEKKRIKHIF